MFGSFLRISSFLNALRFLYKYKESNAKCIDYDILEEVPEL